MEYIVVYVALGRIKMALIGFTNYSRGHILGYVLRVQYMHFVPISRFLNLCHCLPLFKTVIFVGQLFPYKLSFINLYNRTPTSQDAGAVSGALESGLLLLSL